MVQTNIQKLNLESITKFNNNFRHLMSGKLSISLLLKYLIKSNHINPKLNETFVPKFMGNWVYSSILQNSQIGTSLTNYTKILYMYHQFGIPQKVDVIKSFANENNFLHIPVGLMVVLIFIFVISIVPVFSPKQPTSSMVTTST